MNSRFMFVYLGLLIVTLASGCGNPAGGTRRDHSMDMSSKGLVTFIGSGNGGSELYTIRIKDGTRIKLTDTSDYEHSPSFDSGGSYVIYGASPKLEGPSHIHAQTLKGAGRRQITTGTVYDRDPRVSPDGKQVVFTRSTHQRRYSMGGTTWDEWDIYIVDIAGTKLQRLTKAKYYGASSPDISPDNSRIIYAGDLLGSTGSRIWSIDLKSPSRTPRRLQGGYDCSFSPDGKKIVYISDRGSLYDYEVWVMNADGTGSKRLTTTKSYNTRPRFSEDGKNIYFLSDKGRNGNLELWQVDVDGKNLRRLLRSNQLR